MTDITESDFIEVDNPAGTTQFVIYVSDEQKQQILQNQEDAQQWNCIRGNPDAMITSRITYDKLQSQHKKLVDAIENEIIRIDKDIHYLGLSIKPKPIDITTFEIIQLSPEEQPAQDNILRRMQELREQKFILEHILKLQNLLKESEK